MRLFGILCVRDESDIIEESLQYNAQFFDQIFVYDTGSSDRTWEIVQEVARSVHQIVPFRKEALWWDQGLRAVVFEEFRSRARDGDWWARLDADEFFHVSPRVFIEQLRPEETVVHYALYNFYLTDQEAQALRDTQTAMSDRTRSIQVRRTKFRPIFGYSEYRLFRYRSGMRWLPRNFAPYNIGFVARRRIPIRHYPFRDPLQMEQRFRIRHLMYQEIQRRNQSCQTYWETSDWQSVLVSGSDPSLLTWSPHSGALPECNQLNHLSSPLRRMLQRGAHSMLLPILDRTREKYPANFQPNRMPDLLVRQLAESR